MSVLAVLAWFVLPAPHPWASADGADYGLWEWIPAFLQKGDWSLGISVCCAALTVYLLSELTNAVVLLRVNSRMLDSMLAFLLAAAVVCHQFQPGSVVMCLSLLSFFPLLSAYQQPNQVLSFTAYLMLSVASLLFPKFLWVIPFYWLLQSYLRALTLKCFVASLLSAALPYWFYGGVAIVTDRLPDFVAHVSEVATAQWFDYAQLELRDVLTFAMIVLLFVSGAIDFSVHRFLDKTRTRILYNTIIVHGIGVMAFIVLQPQYFSTLLPLLLIDTAIVFGHFFTLTHNRFSHIYCLVLLVLLIATVAIQYVPIPLWAF